MLDSLQKVRRRLPVVSISASVRITAPASPVVYGRKRQKLENQLFAAVQKAFELPAEYRTLAKLPKKRRNQQQERALALYRAAERLYSYILMGRGESPVTITRNFDAWEVRLLRFTVRLFLARNLPKLVEPTVLPAARRRLTNMI